MADQLKHDSASNGQRKTDPTTIRIVAFSFCVGFLTSIVGSIVLAFHGRDTPQVVATAITLSGGYLAGLLTPAPRS